MALRSHHSLRGTDEGVADDDGEGVGVTWLLALWDYLCREHSSAPLADLVGWPLLPSKDGVAYALSSDGLRGSRMFDCTDVDPVLVRCLSGAGLQLHADVSRSHPQLMNFVHKSLLHRSC